MSLKDQMAQDFKDTALAELGEQVNYVDSNGNMFSIQAIVTEDINIGDGFSEMDREFRANLGKHAIIRISALDVLEPEYQDQIIQGNITWSVQQKKYCAGQWKLYCSADERGAF